MAWEIEYNNDRKTFDAISIVNAKRKLINQCADTVILQVACKDITQHEKFEIFSPVKIYHDDKLWFTGIVTQTPIYSSAQTEYIEYKISGPWWYLENLIYQQIWKEPIDPETENIEMHDITKTRLILGQDINGDNITIHEQISEVIAYASTVFGDEILRLSDEIDIPVFIPFDEVKDLSCAEVIKRLLRWVPDAIVYFDYTKDIPEMNIKRHFQMDSTQLEYDTLSEFSLLPRYDLQIPSVVLKFEKTHRANGRSWKTIEMQAFPENATGHELRALVMTIPLDGSNATYIKQDVETEMIQISSEAWWKKHLPFLDHVLSFSIKNPTRTGKLTNELVSGAIAEWMDCEVENDVIRAYISYDSDFESVENKEIAIKINATNADSKTYSNLVNYTTEEQVPSNLAEQIYLSTCDLQYDGRVRYTMREIDDVEFLGARINILGGDIEWSTMNAVVQSVEENIATGDRNIQVGPAKHLGPDDLSEMTKSNRKRSERKISKNRASGESESSGYVEQSKYNRVENSISGPGAFRKLTFSNPDLPSQKIIINTGDMDRDVTVQMREEYVSENGILRKRYSLASEPFSLS